MTADRDPWWRDDGWKGLPVAAADEDDFDIDQPDAAELAQLEAERRYRWAQDFPGSTT